MSNTIKLQFWLLSLINTMTYSYFLLLEYQSQSQTNTFACGVTTEYLL